VKNIDLARERLGSQRLVGAPFAKPEDVVGWLGAVQAQDFAGAKWAVAQRTKACSDDDVEQACSDGRILRTHVLRPTWHFVLPADIRWMLAFSAPRIRAAMGFYDRKLGLTDAVCARSAEALAKALRGGNHLTRTELARVLAAAGIPAAGQRLGHLMVRAEIDAVICSGARRGKQFTYALLDERAPEARPRARDDAMAELARRYFISHGPALSHDFAWWAGVTVADAKRAIELARPGLREVMVDGKRYWRGTAPSPAGARRPVVHLLPNYDELVVAYGDRSASINAERLKGIGTWAMAIANNLIAVDGQAVGGWRRLVEKKTVIVETVIRGTLEAGARAGLRAAAERLEAFLGTPVKLRPSRDGKMARP
jgi:winged helix DNA-binding protein